MIGSPGPEAKRPALPTLRFIAPGIKTTLTRLDPEKASMPAQKRTLFPHSPVSLRGHARPRSASPVADKYADETRDMLRDDQAWLLTLG